MIELEKHGIPTVTIVAEPFRLDAKMTARAFGLPQLATTVVSSVITNLSPEQIYELIDSRTTERIIEGLTQRLSAEKETVVAPPKALRFEGRDLLEASQAMNTAFLEYGWGDGFPIVPPTEEAVTDMLHGSRRLPSEVVCTLEPGMGTATVEKIAINAVMAGCRPGHLPVVIAAVEAISDPKFNLRMVAMSTGPHTPMLVINGPIAKELKINSGTGALGPGAQSYANTVIGRALRLVLMNIGQAYVGVMDMDTIGSPNKYSMCIAENEDENPWKPLHVERGFGKEVSTVTAFPIESQMEIVDFASSTPEGILTTSAGTATGVGAASAQGWLQEGRCWHNLLLLCPEHAEVISRHGWSKRDIREYLYHHALVPARLLQVAVPSERMIPGLRWISDSPGDMLLPITGGPGWFEIVVVGGAAGKSSYITGIGEPVTREIHK